MDYIGKGEILTNMDVNKFVHNIWEKKSVRWKKNQINLVQMEHLEDFFFQLMKHGTNTLHFLFVQCSLVK